jgi:hypothetical protein
MAGNWSKQLDEFNIVDPSKVQDLGAGIDFSKSIKRAGDSREKMKHGFKYGKKRGESTEIAQLNPHFTWKPGFLYCITGWPQHGKSEFTQFLTLLKSKFAGKKWAYHSPENYPEEEFFDTLIHTLVGLSTDPRWYNQMTEKEYDDAIDFIHEHFFYVYEEGVMHTPAFLREAFGYIHAEENLYGIIKDPWNKLAHLMGSLRDDQYLIEQLSAEQKFARESNLLNIILAHPRSMGLLAKGEPLPIPNQYSLAGGAMWDNACDVIACTYRPNYHTDKTDTATQFITHKIKKQNLVGTPGSVDFNFNRLENRYYIEGKTPIDLNAVATEYQPEKIRTDKESKNEFDTPVVIPDNDLPF